jgi:hypothetical protein
MYSEECREKIKEKVYLVERGVNGRIILQRNL